MALTQGTAYGQLLGRVDTWDDFTVDNLFESMSEVGDEPNFKSIFDSDSESDDEFSITNKIFTESLDLSTLSNTSNNSSSLEINTVQIHTTATRVFNNQTNTSNCKKRNLSPSPLFVAGNNPQRRNTATHTRFTKTITTTKRRPSNQKQATATTPHKYLSVSLQAQAQALSASKETLDLFSSIIQKLPHQDTHSRTMIHKYALSIARTVEREHCNYTYNQTMTPKRLLCPPGESVVEIAL